MATMKNARLALTTQNRVAYTAPANGARITMAQVCNTDGALDCDVWVIWTDASASNVGTYLAFGALCAAKQAISVVAGGLWLDGGDTITAFASADGDAQLTIVAIEG